MTPATMENADTHSGITNAKLGIWLFLASEIMLFATLFTTSATPSARPATLPATRSTAPAIARLPAPGQPWIGRARVSMSGPHGQREALVLQRQRTHAPARRGEDRIAQRRGERRTVQGIVDKLLLRPPQIERAVASFSGGNRQKILLARGLTRDISVYLFDEPTVGVDVGAKIEIYRLMNKLAESGAAILMVSAELPEIMGMTDRVLVMRNGRLVKELTTALTTQDEIIRYATLGE